MIAPDTQPHSPQHPLQQSHAGNDSQRVRNACFRCGATAYRMLIARDANGVMRPSGRYQCAQCRLEFSDVRAWRDGHASS
jgi:predicted SprT family Zn-dependent metalloprotease